MLWSGVTRPLRERQVPVEIAAVRAAAVGRIRLALAYVDDVALDRDRGAAYCSMNSLPDCGHCIIGTRSMFFGQVSAVSESNDILRNRRDRRGS